MRLQFKQQRFQTEAARAVADVFAGQPYQVLTGGCNAPIVPALSDHVILEQLQAVQRRNQIKPSGQLEGRYNLTIEMETGVGKTYTYIKTIYELNKSYGWTKFIVVVPSIAVREGVYKTFQTTQEHFAGEYKKKIRFFIYQSSQLSEIKNFAADNSIQVMIINSQAFNAKGKEARRIYMKLDDFGSRRPIDWIAGTNPVLIIDEPQSVEGRQTRKRLFDFHPLMTLRYSATHRPDSLYNMVYRLDALEAYNQRLVKKIAVKGITQSGTSSGGYVYLESIRLSATAPTAMIQFEQRSGNGIRKVSIKAGTGYDLYRHSGYLDEYREGFVVREIDGRDNSIEFENGLRVYAGDVIGGGSQEQIRRIQIRETILSHIQRERQLFCKGIKVLSLFFIDEVDHYKCYDTAGHPYNGIFADMFEEEYEDIVNDLCQELGDEEYRRYLAAIPAEKTHAGYFSVDKKGKITNSKLSDKREKISDDRDAYDLIMKNKELLLEQDPKRSPVRFLFSHSALREGWDNPNVFQICTLKSSGSEVRKHQEVGRGMRLCVNQNGERMDASVLGEDVHRVNVLTVIASESYESFAKSLQAEITQSMEGDRTADPCSLQGNIEDARGNNVELCVDEEIYSMQEFQTMWNCIGQKSMYQVKFDSEKLVKNAVDALNNRLLVSHIHYEVEAGQLKEIDSERGVSFEGEKIGWYEGRKPAQKSNTKYDLVGKLVDETGLTRKLIAQILTGMKREVFKQFLSNPEEFMIKAGILINEQKTFILGNHIFYKKTGEYWSTDIFTKAVIRGKLGNNAMKTQKHLYDYLVYDSEREREFAQALERDDRVAMYVKLPGGFFITTPAGCYTPSWAVAFRERDGQQACAVVETDKLSGSDQTTEKVKRWCARKHFQAVGADTVVFVEADSFSDFMSKIVEK